MKKPKTQPKLYRRGKKLNLKHTETGKIIPITVVMHDSRQGILTSEYEWIRTTDAKEWGWKGPYYEIV